MPIFSERSRVYPFTTENLAGYMKDLNLEDKKVLSITGSGDHILNSFYYGASSVVGFDINSLASLFGELKFNALGKLKFKDFKKYFFWETPNRWTLKFIIP
jgi:S-adenosylmethionine:diacylglycerol 3-amino-3-carboxypropyl transferase